MPTFRELPRDVLVFLLKNKRLEKVSLNDSIDSPIDEHGTTVLHSSVFWEDLGLVTALLKAKANPNIRDGAGRTPLFRVHGKHPGDMLRVLVSHGANIDYTCNGKTFLDYLLLLEGEQSKATLHKISIWEIEHFEFTEKLKGLTISHLEQRISDIQGSFSAIAEAIFLKESSSLKASVDGSFKVDAKRLKKYADYTALRCDLSDLFWQKLLEYGKRVHECYLESLEPKEPNEFEKALALTLLEQHFTDAMHFNLRLASVLANEHSEDSKQKEEQMKLIQEFALSRTADTLYDIGDILEPSNPARQSAFTQYLSSMAKELASAANNVMSSGSKEESKAKGQAEASPPLILSRKGKSRAIDKTEGLVQRQRLVQRKERAKSF